MTANNKNGRWWPFHLAFWLSPVFAVPLFVVINNPEDVVVSPLIAALVLAALTAVLTGLSTWLGSLLSAPWRRRVAIVLLAAGLTLVLQGNLVHEFFYYGEFNGNAVNWRTYGIKFWLELTAFCLALPLIAGPLLWLKRIPLLLQWLPALSCALLLIPALIAYLASPPVSARQDFDSTVFEFSKDKNLIHLLPDGFQGDLVREVLEENPHLSRAFSGFTLFTDHLGMYQGTAPSVPALLAGRPAVLHQGDTATRFRDMVREHGYQNQLSAAGFYLDYVGGSTGFCPDDAGSCVTRPFNDLKSRGYFRFRGESLGYAIRLIGDLTLFRLTPMYLKERIYNDGNWLLSDTTADGSSPLPDPVLREWTEHMRVVDGPPRFKWYHYIGTHLPAQWDRRCHLLRNLKHNRESAAGQTYCVLSGLAAFLDRLRELDIYDQTAIVISGDHGTNLAPYDLVGEPANASLYHNIVGQARPALLVKTLANRNPLAYNSAPTSLIDVAPTALSLVGLSGQFEGQAAFEVTPGQPRTRYFHRYDSRRLWSGEPVPFTRFAVSGPANISGNWRLETIFTPLAAPSDFATLSQTTAGAFMRGAQLNAGNPDQEGAWVKSSHLAFLMRPARRDPGPDHRLLITLRIPEFVGDQQVRLTVNSQPLGIVKELPAADEFWHQAIFEVPNRLLHEGNNFMELEFAVVGQAPDHPAFRASALIRAMALD